MSHSISLNDEDFTVAAFDRWLKTARAGSRYIYYKGHLAIDRETITLLPAYGTYVHVFYEPMHHLGLMAWNAYEHGHVHLVQHKIATDVYEYIAVKRPTQKRRLS